ncbi:MAG: SH3 domain-containing protein [Alphaproteobacteria bacterium]|nr:SH3 domain-containing protein [Alphaproteobacteria bacterium]
MAAQEPAKNWEGTISARTLNVRAGPAKNQGIVAKVKRGDRVQAFDEEGSWVHIRGFDDSDNTGWVSRSFVRLPKDFMAPAFGDVENAFLEWASARGDLSVVSIESDNRLSLVLDLAEGQSRAATVALEVACAYRARLALEVPVVATVWPEAGPRNGWIAQVSCP